MIYSKLVRHISEQNVLMPEAGTDRAQHESKGKVRARPHAGRPQRFCVAYMPKVEFAFLVLIFSVISTVFAQDVDENAMFADTQTVVENTPSVKAALAKNSFGVSGEISSVSLLNLGRDENSYANTALGEFYIDARYNTNYKIFANVETSHVWENNESKLRLPECFADTPIANKVYLRWGRQVLQWGRCQLWTPTDLINVDKKTFMARIGAREGVYGVKMHIPWGTKYNLYGFLDTGSKFDSQHTGGALKFEWLLGGTEMAVSYWNKKEYMPVYGYDISSKVFNVDINGEVSTSQGFTRNMLSQDGGELFLDKRRDAWITRAAIDLGKSFHFNNQADKINLTGEFFYNGAGYRDNIFRDRGVYSYRDAVVVNGIAFTGGEKKTFLLGHGLYDANYYGKYYAAAFMTVNNFMTSDFTFSVNVIDNLCDYSGIASTGIKYQNIRDWYIDFMVYGYFGPKNCEYTYLKQTASFQLTLGWKF